MCPHLWYTYLKIWYMVRTQIELKGEKTTVNSTLPGWQQPEQRSRKTLTDFLCFLIQTRLVYIWISLQVTASELGEPECKEGSAERKQRPPHDLRCFLAARMRGLLILTIITAFCSFSINLTWADIVFVFGFSTFNFPELSSCAAFLTSVCSSNHVAAS